MSNVPVPEHVLDAVALIEAAMRGDNEALDVYLAENDVVRTALALAIGILMAHRDGWHIDIQSTLDDMRQEALNR